MTTIAENNRAFKVFKREDVSSRKNAYKVDREETWKFSLIKTFHTYDEALNYIKVETLKDLDYIRLTCGSNLPQEETLKSFLNDKKFFTLRKYFIDTVPIEELMEALKNDGIKVIDERERSPR